MSRPGPIDPSNTEDCHCPHPNVTHRADCRWAERERALWAASLVAIGVEVAP